MKQQILSEISRKLSAMGVPVENGNGTDITVSTEFLDAGWSTGSKKVNYEASVYVNEQDSTVYMFERTKEVGQGLSFGGDSGSYFQSGKTLFRKVKSVQYGSDGKAYEYSLDLGAIPKAVKETAKQYGWKFKIVLNKNKALYPEGYTPEAASTATQSQPVGQTPQAAQYCSSCGIQLPVDAKFCSKCGNPAGVLQQQAQNQYNQQAQPRYAGPQGQFHSEAKRKGGSKGGIFGLIGFILLGISLAAMLAAGKATAAGWAISAAVFAAAFLLQRLLSKRGCLLNLILWVVTGFILLVILTVVTKDDLNLAGGSKNTQMTAASTSTSSASPAQAAVNAASAAFRIDYLSYGLWPGFTYGSDSGNDMNLAVNGDITFSLYANPMNYSGSNDKVSRIAARVSLLQPPSTGTVKLYRFRPDLAAAPNRPADMKKYGLPSSFDIIVSEKQEDTEKPENYLISFANSINYSQVRIYYCIEDLMSVKTASWMDSIPAAVSKGITSDALRSKIGIELLMTMESGEKHRIYFEREIMKGDFFSKTRLDEVVEDYQGKETPLFSEKAS